MDEADDGMDGVGPIMRAYRLYIENLTPEQEAESQSRFSQIVAWFKTPEGQAETARLQAYYASLPRPGRQ